MGQSDLEDRVSALEFQFEEMKSRLDQDAPQAPWWQQIIGTFQDDPIFDEAMRLGREYRESLRPKPRAKSRAKG